MVLNSPKKGPPDARMKPVKISPNRGMARKLIPPSTLLPKKQLTQNQLHKSTSKLWSVSIVINRFHTKKLTRQAPNTFGYFDIFKEPKLHLFSLFCPKLHSIHLEKNSNVAPPWGTGFKGALVKIEGEKSPAPGGNQTQDLSVPRRELYRCATTTAQRKCWQRKKGKRWPSCPSSELRLVK